MTADVCENMPKMKFDNNGVFGNAISFPDGLLALQLQLPFQVGLFSFGLVAAAPDGPSDDESGFDPALG